MVTAICYETKEHDKFLAYLTWKTGTTAEEEVNKLNTEKPNTLWNGDKVDWNRISHFYVNMQEDFY